MQRVAGAFRWMLRSLTTDKTHVCMIEKCARGAIMVPIFGTLLVLLRARALVRGPLRVEVVTRDGNRFMCDLPDLIPLYLYLFGVWEPDLSTFIASRLRDGDAFVDVGANVGYDTLLASRGVGDRGAVAAIEASPTVFDHLTKTLRLNGNPGNVRTINSAASDLAGTLSLYSGPQNNLGLTTTVPRAGMPKVAEVPARPLGELLNDRELANVRLIKIDVEGGEPAVLAGMLASVDRLPTEVEIAVELSPGWWRDTSLTAAAVLRPWIDLGFNVYTIPNNYWPWRYLWPRDVRRPVRVNNPVTLTQRVKRLDIVLSRLDVATL